jgi:protein-L-isoaspartate(D-aspartate) O-methyltransferase
MRFEDQRQILVNDLAKEGITDQAVLAAFLKVPREDYVLPEYREYAYQNRPLPILLAQTISQPLMIAIMLQLLELKKTDSVLEIGTGSGYQSALLAELVKEVCSVERLDILSLNAQKTLKNAGYKNIYFRIGDGHSGWQKAYPPRKAFDKIIVSAAAESIPESLINQLADGSIMAIPVGGSAMQILNIVTRLNGEVSIRQTGGCSFVPFVNDNKPKR